MNARELQRQLCRLGQRIAPADMREWAAAMTREIDEIDDARAALEWAMACLAACAAQRLRALMRVAAAAARFAIGGYCLVVGGQMAVEIAALIADGRTPAWKIGSWLPAAPLFVAAALLVALRRRAGAWTFGAATAITAANFLLGAAGAPAAAAPERLAAFAIIAVMASATAAAFWLTRPPDADLVV